jgi:hypothetical protein
MPLLLSHLYTAGDASARRQLCESNLAGARRVLDSRIAARIVRSEMRNPRRPIP